MKPRPDPATDFLRFIPNDFIQIITEEPTRALGFLQQLPISVALTDATGRILYGNRRFYQMTRAEPEQVVGQTFRLFKSGYHSDAFYRILWKAIKDDKREWHGVFKNRDLHGNLYWEDSRITPILDAGGNVLYYLCVKENITERKEERERHQAILHRAKNVQRFIVTETLPCVPGFDISALYKPAEIISGDLFLVRAHAGKLAVILADSTGHGVEAALNASLLKTYLYHFESMLHEAKPRVGEFLAEVNRELLKAHFEENDFPTVFALSIDLETLCMTCSGSGLYPYLFKDRRLKLIDAPGGPLLKVIEDAEFPTAEVQLSRGDTLCLASDGIYEARMVGKKESAMLDHAFFQSCLDAYPQASHVKNIGHLFRALTGQNLNCILDDDATMVLVELLPEERKHVVQEARKPLFL